MSANLDLFLDSLGWALLHSLWQIAGIAGLVWLALRIVPERKPSTRFAIAYSGMIASLGAFLITFVGYFGTGSAEPAAGAALALTPAGGPLEWLGQATWGISLIWSLGFAALSLRYVRALRATYRLRSIDVLPVPDFWERNFALWVARVGVDPRTAIRQTPHVSSPVTIGALKPIVLVPVGFVLHLPREQAEAILLHELAHICRQDYLLGLIEEMVKTVFFYHPCIFWLSRQIDAEREYACDELVLAETGDACALARGLGQVAVGSRGRATGFAMAANGGPVPVLDRIRRLAGAPAARSEGSAGLATAISLMLLSASCLIAIGADASTVAAPDKDKAVPADTAERSGKAVQQTAWQQPEAQFRLASTAPQAAAPAHAAQPVIAASLALPSEKAAEPMAKRAHARPAFTPFQPTEAFRPVSVLSPVQAGLRFAVAQQSPRPVFASAAQAPELAPELEGAEWDAFAENIAAMAEARAEAVCPEATAEAAARAHARADELHRRAEERASRLTALAQARAARASAIATRRSGRIGELAGRMTDLRLRAARMRDEAEADQLEAEADALESELDAETDALDAEIEASMADLT